MEYKASYEIDCGVSHGFALKSPDNIREEITLQAKTAADAYLNAMDLAKRFAQDYLSNPETGFTTVKLLSLENSDGPVLFDASKSVVKVSMLEHLVMHGNYFARII